MGGKPRTAPKKAFKIRPPPKEHHHPKSNIAKFQKEAKKRFPTLKPVHLNADTEPSKPTASKFRTYIHVAAPEFREEAVRQVKSLLLASAPRLKTPKIMTKGNQGLLIDATLRDIYVLSHGLRCADDIMIQLGRPQHKVGSFNRFVKHLAKLPLHAFAPRIMPHETPHRVGKQSKEKDLDDKVMKELAETPLLHNNIRILTKRSILSNQTALKQFSVETVRKLLTLRRGQSLKKRNVKYTDNPALFGKAEDEIEETLLQLAEERAARYQQRIEMRQIKLIAERAQNESHLRNLFSTNMRKSIEDEQSQPKSTFTGQIDGNDEDSGIPMHNNRNKYTKRGGIQRRGPKELDVNEDDEEVQRYGSSESFEAILDQLNDDELRLYIDKRKAHFRKMGIEYNPEEDPIIQDFIANNDAMHISDNDEGIGDGQYDGTDAEDLDDVRAPNGTSINYNDFVGPDGQLDTAAFNNALQLMLQTQGFSVDDLEETNLQDVAGKVGEHVKKVRLDELEHGKDSKTQKHRDDEGTGENTKSEGYDVQNEDNGDVEEIGDDIETPFSLGDENDDVPIDTAAIIDKYTPEQITNATIYNKKLNFLRDEVYLQAVARGDSDTVKRILIERDEMDIEGKLLQRNVQADSVGGQDEVELRAALDVLAERDQELEDVKFLRNLQLQIDEFDDDDDDDGGEDDLSNAIAEKTDQNKAKNDKNKNKNKKEKDLKTKSDERVEQHLLPHKEKLSNIQSRLTEQPSGAEFYLEKLAEYGQNETKSQKIGNGAESISSYHQVGTAEPITNVFDRYRTKFNPITAQSARTRVREREPMVENAVEQKLQNFEQEQAPPTPQLSSDNSFDATVPNNVKIIDPFNDSDVEYPSDWTEGEGVELHRKSHNAEKRQKKRTKKQAEREEMDKKLKQDISANLDPAAQLDLAIERISKGASQPETKTHVLLPDGSKRRLLAPSLLAVAWSHVGKHGTNASKRILAKATTSTPRLHTFIPPEYRGLSEKRLRRRARHDPILRMHLEKAHNRVESMKNRFKRKDAKVRRDLGEAGELSLEKQPALMIPFRPHSDIPHSCMTISLRRNTLRVSISAIGARHQALYKRGYRTNLIETSLRESIANGALGIAYNKMTPISPDSPLMKLETDDRYLQPIRSSLLYLAKDVRVGLNPEELQQNSWSPEQQLRQEHFLKTAVTILGEEQTQKQLMNALLETRRDVLSNPNALNEVVHQGVDPMAGKRKKKWHKPQFNPLSTTLLDDVVEKMNDEQFDVLVQQLTAKNGGNVPLGVDGFPISLKPIQPMLTGKKKPFEQDNGQNEENSNQNEQTISNNDDITANTPSDPTDPTTPALVNNNDHNPDPKTPPLPSFNQIKSKPISKSELVKSFKLSSTDIMDAVSLIPSYHQAQAVTALAAALPFDPAMPLASPTITPLRSVAIHTRDHTPLREVLSHTLSSGVIDADPSIRVYDPFCGSGTLVIESVFRFLGLPLQPLQRPFAFENWPIHDEYQYNALMWEWKGRYQHIVKDFIKTFGITKYQTLNGDFSQIEGLKNDGTDRIVDFPLFVGTDLRHKSVRASISNANNAGINYFTHFFQSDFQKVIYEANRLWKYQKEEEDKKLLEERLAQESARNINDDFFSQFSGSLSHSPSSLSHSQSSNLRPKNTLLSLDDALDDMLGESIPGVPQQRKKQSPTSPLLTPTLPLTKPYLKGYTMFSNIPWGVVDEKPDRWSRKDDNATRYANTTQQEPVEDLYIRMGRTLHDNKDLFRDVFVLSAHQKFEKLTAIGAQRQARDNERKFGVDAMIAKTQKQQPGLVKFENGVSIYSAPKTTEGTLEWDNVSTFYNNGVKTHLLKLRM